MHRGTIQKLDHCPFCNGELPKEKTQSCLDAAIAEADRIELRIRDLQQADQALMFETSRLEEQKEFDLHMPHLLVMDSPILSLKEREENVGTERTSDSMRGGLFQYMIDHEENRQTIILENEIPSTALH